MRDKSLGWEEETTWSGQTREKTMDKKKNAAD